MIDTFDYAEPDCPLCNGRDFYDPKPDVPLGRIPVARIIAKVDGLFDKNDEREAGRLLRYWRDEAIALRDRHGELSMESELVGHYRKAGDRERTLTSARRAIDLVEELEQGDMAAGATILINCATAYKAFGMAGDALPLYRRAEETYRRTLAAGDARFGGLYNNMALALQDLGLTEEAEAAYRSALAIMKAIPGGEAESAITYINLAHMYEATGHTDRIAACLGTAYALLKDDGLARNGYYAFVLQKCAPSFGYFGDHAAYRELMQAAEEIYART